MYGRTVCARKQHMTRSDIENIIKNRKNDEFIDLKKVNFDDNLDLSNLDLHNIDFTDATGEGINFSNSNLSGSIFTGTRLEHINFTNANLKKALLKNCDMRFANFTNADLRGTIFSCTIMECSIHDNVKIDETTENYRMVCPEKGAFIGYKKCFNDLIVTLLIPADARRVSSTTRPCRCDKAKVINITSFDETEHYKEAWSLCSSYDFKYPLGEYVYPDSFNPDRWMESTHGIHFWMTKEEAKKY